MIQDHGRKTDIEEPFFGSLVESISHLCCPLHCSHQGWSQAIGGGGFPTPHPFTISAFGYRLMTPTGAFFPYRRSTLNQVFTSENVKVFRN